MERMRRCAVWVLTWTLVFPVGPGAGSPTPAASPAPRAGAAPQAAALLASSQPYLATTAPVIAAVEQGGGAPPRTGCAAAANPIVCENALAGTPPATWEITGIGDPNIQGYATKISVDWGEPVDFKIKTSASAYKLDIYRMGYYQGNGARYVATVFPDPASGLPQAQPACAIDATLGKVDCGTWGRSATWTMPSDTVSGIYFARLIRTDGVASQGSHVLFVVRDDTGGSDLLFQTSDTTWQAYNAYADTSLATFNSDGGWSLYRAPVSVARNPNGLNRARKVSYNRPLWTALSSQASWVWNAESPMVRWLEANGYDVSYSTGLDTDARGSELLEHKVFVSVGHDEYWSGVQRQRVEEARNAGIHLAFFSGNEVFWKTRWEDGHQTLVCYKDTHDDGPVDPIEWTGTWRDNRFPAQHTPRPENALTGTIFTVNGPRVMDAIEVPASFAGRRFWRNTSIAALAPNQKKTLPIGTLGYEWDEDLDNGHRPAGLFHLSSTTLNVDGYYIQDQGSTYGSGVATHHLTMYRAPGGALVFGAGTVQWAWGLDGVHDRGSEPPSLDMQQATVNLFADMGVLPATPAANIVVTTPPADLTAPTAQIALPAVGATVQIGSAVAIEGTAADVDGVVAGVEVSTDNGVTWRLANGTASWTYNWIPAAPTGAATLLARAVDDSANLGASSAPVQVNVERVCPCSLWDDATIPNVVADGFDQPIELGMRFRTQIEGVISGIRFYKGPGNLGTHVGSLWTNTGVLLERVTFTNESAGGWQEATFATPVHVDAGTTYVVSYFAPQGHFSVDRQPARPGFLTSFSNPPLVALADSPGGDRNGVFAVAGAPTFPVDTFESTNYWVDVVFSPNGGTDTISPTVTAKTPVVNATGVSPFANVTATFNEAIDPSTVTPASFELRKGGVLVASAVSYTPSMRTATLDPGSPLVASTVYTARIYAGMVKDTAGNPLLNDVVWSFTIAPPVVCNPCTIWPASATPIELENNIFDNNAVELGVKFRSDVDGTVHGVRFYKGNEFNAGPHVGSLWSSDGTRLAYATFAAETSSGWQQVLFATPVPIVANQTYIVSYHAPFGRYARDVDYFAASDFYRAPLRALRNGEDGPNGVYAYTPSPGVFPNNTFEETNYWVDVVFVTAPAGNNAPTANSQSVTVVEDTPTAITLTGSDPDGDQLTFNVPEGGGPAHGALSGTGATRTYTPNVNFTGTDTFTFTANDGSTDSNIATVSITVTPVNDAPVLAPIGDKSGSENALLTFTVSGADVDGDSLTYSAGGMPAGASFDPVTRTFAWIPGFDQAGSYQVTFTVTDSASPAASDSETITVTIENTNRAPVAVDDSYAVDEDTVLTIPAPGVAGNDTDADGQSLTAALVSGPSAAQGTLALNGNGSFTFTPALNFNGTATFTYRANDGEADSNVATVTITVNSVNDPPTASAGGPYGPVAEGGSILVTAAGADPVEGNTPLTFAWDLDNNGTFETPGQTVSFTAVDGPGIATLKVRVTDSLGASTISAPTTVTIVNVSPVAGAITWSGSTDSLAINTSRTATATFTDAGIADTHTATFNWGDGVTTAASITEAGGSGSASASHAYAAPGNYTVTFTVTDKDGDSAQSIFQYVIVVNPAGKYETGGGSIASATGSYPANPSLGGNSTITSLYARYAADGTMNYASNSFKFSYTAASLSFTSTKMFSLVLNGSTSWLRGEGTTTISGVNTPSYYLVSVVDSTGGVVDKVRVKIWRKDSGAVIYDNQMGAIDVADATPLAGSYGTVTFR